MCGGGTCAGETLFAHIFTFTQALPLHTSSAQCKMSTLFPQQRFSEMSHMLNQLPALQSSVY